MAQSEAKRIEKLLFLACDIHYLSSTTKLSLTHVGLTTTKVFTFRLCMRHIIVLRICYIVENTGNSSEINLEDIFYTVHSISFLFLTETYCTVSFLVETEMLIFMAFSFLAENEKKTVLVGHYF